MTIPFLDGGNRSPEASIKTDAQPWHQDVPNAIEDLIRRSIDGLRDVAVTSVTNMNGIKELCVAVVPVAGDERRDFTAVVSSASTHWDGVISSRCASCHSRSAEMAGLRR